MSSTGYFRFPTISKNIIVFLSEDDLWSVPSTGGDAIRLTSNLGNISHPQISPDGKWIAYVGKEEGNTEVYVMPSNGGESTRLTYLAAMAKVVGWSADSKKIIFSSNSAQPFPKMFKLYNVNIRSGEIDNINVGIGHNISYAKDGRSVLGINTNDPARWKRYRGGTAGVIWIDPTGKRQYRKVKNINGNLGSPMWIDNRVYFISDHEGIGNIYSVNSQGRNIKKHTDHKELFVRNASTDGTKIVYHSGGELFVLDPTSNENAKVEVNYNSPRIQRQRKFVPAEHYLQDFKIHSEGHSILINSRGKAFNMGVNAGPVEQVFNQKSDRIRLIKYLNTKSGFVAINDFENSEAIEVVRLVNGKESRKRFDTSSINRIIDLKISPDDKYAAVCNQKNQCHLVDLESGETTLVERSKFHRIHGFNWSPDSKWLVYGISRIQRATCLRLYEVKTKKRTTITQGDFNDFNPCFDAQGRFIYFLSTRTYNPVYDSIYFDLNFPMATKPYIIALQKDQKNPFLKEAKAPDDGNMAGMNLMNGKKSDEMPDLKIDLDDITSRVNEFPVKEDRYIDIKAYSNGILLLKEKVKGSIGNSWSNGNIPADNLLEQYDLEMKELKQVEANITSFDISSKSETLALQVGRKINLRPLFKMNVKAANLNLDLNRIKLDVEPSVEWKQMYNEIWRLQKEHFWLSSMAGIDWKKVYGRYEPLVDRLNTRTELSDLIWEVQGELGTSHAYEMGGDHRQSPSYFQGLLGLDYEYDNSKKAYKITHIIKGDIWSSSQTSSLNNIGIDVKEGDFITSINGIKLNKGTNPGKALVNMANNEVLISIKSAASGKTNTHRIKAMASDTPARYREWVEKNRQYVHKKSKGTIGYVHVPNMGPVGYAEFHRYYELECDYQGLIVDVRFNGGGHVSQLLLEKLARKRIGYGIPRWGQPNPYPMHSVFGYVLALTNEYAGSDGDIFSHNFKQMELGKLVGKRTWGGVVGIWPRHTLIDNSITTQPEFSTWFKDVGYGVENYGTDPDIEVEITPMDWSKKKDSQLDKSIDILTKDIKKKAPGIPDFGPTPDLSLPK